jgi:hypothetical protein
MLLQRAVQIHVSVLTQQRKLAHNNSNSTPAAALGRCRDAYSPIGNDVRQLWNFRQELAALFTSVNNHLVLVVYSQAVFLQQFARLANLMFFAFPRCDQAPTFSINPTSGCPEIEGTSERRVSFKLYLSRICETRGSGRPVCRAIAGIVRQVCVGPSKAANTFRSSGSVMTSSQFIQDTASRWRIFQAIGLHVCDDEIFDCIVES